MVLILFYVMNEKCSLVIRLFVDLVMRSLDGYKSKSQDKGADDAAGGTLRR